MLQGGLEEMLARAMVDIFACLFRGFPFWAGSKKDAKQLEGFSFGDKPLWG